MADHHRFPVWTANELLLQVCPVCHHTFTWIPRHNNKAVVVAFNSDCCGYAYEARPISESPMRFKIRYTTIKETNVVYLPMQLMR